MTRFSQQSASALTLTLTLTLALTACGESPTGPGTPGPPPPPPPPPANTAPVVRGITLGASRTEVGQPVSVVADVSDAETAVDALTYQWSSSAGTISGTGRSVTWSLPKGATNTPANVVITLTVTEPYQALVGGQIVTQQHRVSATSGIIRAHDSAAELGEIAHRFLVDYFGDSAVPPGACMVDFSDGCAGKADELAEIVDNRARFNILTAHATIRSVVVNQPFSTASIVASCAFRDIEKATNIDATSSGDCTLTAVYHDQRWWLCTSLFLNGTRVETGTGKLLRLDERRWRVR